MGRKGGSRRKGLQADTGVKKSKIRKHKKEDTSDKPADDKKLAFNLSRRELFFKLGEKSFDIASTASYHLFCVQFYRHETGEFVRVPRWRQIIHYMVVVLMSVSMFHKFCIAIVRFNEQESPDVETFMCGSLFMVQFVGWCMSMAQVYKWRDTMSIINSWKRCLACIDETGNMSPVQDVTTDILLMVCIYLIGSISTAFGIVSLAFPNLPVCLHTMTKSLQPDIGIPHIVWQLLFLPMEIMIGLASSSSASLAGITLQLGISTQLLYTTKLKNEDTTNPASFEKMVKDYVTLEVFHRVFVPWWNWIQPHALFALSCTVILGMFIGIRHTELPLILYSVYPAAAVSLLFNVFGFAIEVTTVQKQSDEIVENLQMRARSRDPLWIEERKWAMRKIKCMKPLPFQVGPYTEFSFAVPLAAWDEILNQLFFLLSL